MPILSGERRGVSPTPRVIIALLLLTLSGCGSGHYPIRGQVFWSDGAPAKELEGGFVSAESVDTDISARGEIGPDGTFSLSSLKKDDGLPPGTYQVVVSASDPDPSEDKSSPRILGRKMLPNKYLGYQTSGLQISVEAQTNQVKLTLDKQQRQVKP